MFFVTDSQLEAIIREDIPWMDVTTESLGIGSRPGQVACWPKADGFVAGIGLAARVFELAGLQVRERRPDGMYAGRTPVLVAAGTAERVHAVYKTAQNLMEYASGIAGRTRRMVEAARSTNPKAQVAVTRKHFPGTKLVSLAAVAAGGGIVHRVGLSESILVFDQHRVFCEDVGAAIRAAKALEREKKVAVEAGSVAEGLDFVRMGADIVQCERFGLEDLAEFVREGKSLNPSLVVNAAGGINADNAAAVAATGVDVLVTSWVYFGKPFDIKMAISAV